MLKLALFWFRMKMLSRSDRAMLLRKIVLVSCLVLFITCFLSSIVLDSYFIDNRPRQSQPAEGRIYPKSLKTSYGATVYLTEKEKMLSDLLFPFSFIIMVIGIALNTRWKLFAPYKKSKSDLPIATKRKNPD
jgi:hypothetical protein